MIAEGRALAELHEHVVVKVPFCKEGLEATHALTSDGIPVNMTLVFSPNQALLAAGAGATYVSCFMGRLDDISVDSTAVVKEIVDCFRAGGVTSQIIAASIRHPEHVVTSAKLGCEIATVPAKVLRQMLDHPLTTQGAEKFKADWETRPEFGEWLEGPRRGAQESAQADLGTPALGYIAAPWLRPKTSHSFTSPICTPRPPRPA